MIDFWESPAPAKRQGEHGNGKKGKSEPNRKYAGVVVIDSSSDSGNDNATDACIPWSPKMEAIGSRRHCRQFRAMRLQSATEPVPV